MLKLKKIDARIAKEKEDAKKAKKRENLIDKSKKFFTNIKEKNKKFQNRKNVELANKRAFQKYQDIEDYVDFDDYSLTPETLAEEMKKNPNYGYDFTQDIYGNKIDKGLETLTSNKGTSIESIRENLYDVNSPLYGIAGSLVNKIRPDTQVTLENTLQKARDYRDLAGTGEVSREDLDNLRNRGRTQEQIDIIDGGGGGGGGDQQQTDPCLGPNPPAYCAVNNDPADPATPTRNLGGLAPRFAGSIFDFTGLADGGRAGAMDGGRMMMMANQEEDDPTGGIMDLESGRQMYFLGKLVKKATRAVKKVVKSPIGKAALMYGLGSLGASALGKYQAGTGAGGSGFFSKAGRFLLGTKGVDEDGGTLGLLGKLGLTGGFGGFKPTLKGGITLGLGIPALMDLFGKKEEDEGFDIDEYYRTAGLGGQKGIDAIRLAGIDGLANRFKVADGGRINYAEGSEEPVAKKTMPLIDMDGKEMDLREDGGFVPLGRMERADDVPARLSKNEFVFTADAVRNAGEGDIDKGAEVMYNMMKNLESGGEVSEESQGLDGAREMFKTSQRLEEVL
jgi:hypothetical protein